MMGSAKEGLIIYVWTTLRVLGYHRPCSNGQTLSPIEEDPEGCSNIFEFPLE
jgi:hypothetical protein